MKKELYDLMDWRRIEGIVYSEEDQPHGFLGASVTPDGVLIQTFRPDAKSVTVTGKNLNVPMEPVDEEGFFAVLLPGRTVPQYRFEIMDGKGQKKTVKIK